MPKAEDLTNQIIGIIRFIEKQPSKSGKTQWLCECTECGKRKVIQTGHVKSGAIRSCGCGCLITTQSNPNRFMICEICGKTFQLTTKGYTRKYCYDCSPNESDGYSHADVITIKRRAIKKALVMYKGGKCQICGYNKCIRALEFHHLDPSQKDFGISKSITKDMKILKQEVDKCILLCSNCHAEEHQRIEDSKLCITN